jgi:hypothetical protein
MKPNSCARLALVLSLLFSAPLLITGQQSTPPASAAAPQPPAPALKPLLAEDVYQHVEIFKGKPAGVLIPAMNALRGLLGVECTYCHTQYDWANDSKPAKLKARRHFEMIRFINHNYFADRNGATCWTCHGGHPVPAGFQRDEQAIARAAGMIKIPDDSKQKPAEDVFMNIQVLKGVPADRFPLIMSMFSASLGVDCRHCHAEDFSSDEKPEKLKARKMLGMARGILQEFYGGQGPVGCFTCHQGKVKPESESGKPTDAIFAGS